MATAVADTGNSIYSIITCICLETPEPYDICKHSSQPKFIWLYPIIIWNISTLENKLTYI